MKPFFDLDDEELRGEFAEEGFIAEVQYEISLMLKRKDVSRSELARRLGVSAAYVSQLLGDAGGNLTCRTIARIYSAMDEEPKLCTRRTFDAHARASVVGDEDASWLNITSSAVSSWSAEEVTSANKVETSASNGHAKIVWLDAYRRAA
ncbi:helix-turn-helix domain-containing protein [Phenylobacterium deserti]|nr:helix-turn-helix transcriptional regulator [Phenylobacterium deserti]